MATVADLSHVELADFWCRTESKAAFITDGWILEGVSGKADCLSQHSCAIEYLGRAYKCSALSSMRLSIPGRKEQELAGDGVCMDNFGLHAYRGQLCCRSAANH